MTRPAILPPGVFPPRMPVEMAAGYCGERTAESFLRGVRAKLYPEPRVNRGRKKIWWKDDLDRAISPADVTVVDVAEDL